MSIAGVSIGGVGGTRFGPGTSTGTPSPTKIGVDYTAQVYGRTIPLSAGRRGITGVPIWASPLRTFTETWYEHNGTTTGGVTHQWVGITKAKRDFAISFGRHLAPLAERGNVGLLRLWANDKKIWDATDPLSTRPGLEFTVYSGTPTQPQDAAMLADRGEVVPAYHNLIYIVFTNWVLDQTQGQLPGSGPYIGPNLVTDFKIPVIRAEFVDGLVVSNSTLDFVELSGSALEDPDNAVIPNWEENQTFAFSQVSTSAAQLHTYDNVAGVELTRTTIAGTYTNFNGLAQAIAYDYRNGIVYANKNGTPNTGVVCAINLNSSAIVSEFGVQSGNTTPTQPGGAGTAITSIPWIRFADLAYVGDGNAEPRTVGLFTASVTDYLTAIAMNSDGSFPASTGTSGTTFSEPGISSYQFAETGSFASLRTLPLWEFSKETQQDGAVIACHGQSAWVVLFGIRGGVAKLFGRYLLKDFGAGFTAKHVLLDPKDRGVIIFYEDSSTNWFATKFHCLYSSAPVGPTAAALNGWGWRGIFPAFGMSYGSGSFPTAGPVYEAKPVPDMNALLIWDNLFKYSDVSAGTLGFSASPSFAKFRLSDGSFSHTGFTEGLGANYWDSRTESVYWRRASTESISKTAVSAALGADKMIGTYLRWLSLLLGYVDANIDVDPQLLTVNADNTVLGMYIDHPYTVDALFGHLGKLFDFRYFESEGKINFTRAARGESAAAPAFELTLDDLAYTSENSITPNDALVTQIAEPTQQISGVSVQYLDLNQNYSIQSQTYNVDKQTSGNVGTQVDALQVPVVMTTSEAYRRISKVAIRSVGDAEFQDFRLPQKYSRLEPNDVVRITIPPYAYDVMLDEVTFNGDWSISCNGPNFATNDNVTVPDQDDLGDYTDIGFGVGDSRPLVLDVPLLSLLDDPGNATFLLYLGVTTFGQTNFSNANLVAGPLPSGPFNLLFNFADPAQDGITVGTLATTTAPFTTDNTTVLRIALKSSDADDWDSTDEAGLLAGSNAILVGANGRWELIYFRDVTVVNTKVVELSGLLRGRRGTDVNVGNHAAGDQVVLVRSVATGFVSNLHTQPFVEADLDSIIQYRAEGQPQSRPIQSVDQDLVGNTLRPWAVTELQAWLGSSFNVNGTTPDYQNRMGGGTETAPSGISRVPFIDITSAGGTLRVNRMINNAVTTSNDDAAEFVGGFTTESIVFDFRQFGIKQRIIGLKFRQSNTTEQGNWDFEGSNDGITWVPLHSNFDLITGLTSTHSFTNPDYYWMYRLKQFSGSLSTAFSSRVLEVYFETVSETSGDDIVIEWVRRDRLGDEFVDTPQPLSEATEAYEVDIIDGLGNVVRTIATTAPRAVYTSAQQTTDGFTPPLASLRVKVYQMSDVVGRGFEVDKTLTVQ